MTEPADSAGISARVDESKQPNISGMGKRLAIMLNRQIDLLEAEPVTSGYNDEYVKSLLTLAKTVQSMETLCNNTWQLPGFIL